MKVRHSRNGRSFNEPRQRRIAACRAFKSAVAMGNPDVIFAAALVLAERMVEEAMAHNAARAMCSVMVH